jgi:hypothetical protein
MITGSALPRLLNCPTSEVLDHAENASPWADAGNEDHAELAHQVRSGTLPNELAIYVPPSPHAEVKLIYDTATRTGRILGEAADRSYGQPGPTEIPLSTDVVGVLADTVVIVDWKTGHADVEPAATNGQLWGCALAACKALGKHQAIIRIVYTAQKGRCDEHFIDALELAEFAGRLERLHIVVAERRATRATGAVPETREGTWCKYCPSKHVCPSKVGLLVQVAEKGLAVIGETMMTPERVRDGVLQLLAFEDLVKQARARAEAWADENGPIDLGDGRLFGRYVRDGNERLNGDVAATAIAELEFADEATAKRFESIAIEKKTSKAAIDRACKDIKATRGTATKLIKRIRQLGGATHAPETLPIGVFTRDRNEPAEKPEIDADAVNKLLESA